MATHITPVKLHHFNPNIPDECFKCKEVGTMFHCMWGYRELEVLELVSKMTECIVPASMKMCLLHIYPEGVPVNAQIHKRVDFSLLQAKRVIALKWRDTQRPNCTLWIREMSYNLALEKLTYILSGKIEDWNERDNDLTVKYFILFYFNFALFIFNYYCSLYSIALFCFNSLF